VYAAQDTHLTPLDSVLTLMRAYHHLADLNSRLASIDRRLSMGRGSEDFVRVDRRLPVTVTRVNVRSVLDPIRPVQHALR